MKTVIVFCLGIGAGLYLADYRTVQLVKRETVAAVRYLDGAMR